MEVILLGTGAADGWPNPWCRCTSCAHSRDRGSIRTTTSALIDRTLLLDCGPDAPRQADRAGVGLSDVRAILLTHAHPDHWAPETLLARSWSLAARPSDSPTPLRVIGPAAAIDACRHWMAPDDHSLVLEVVTPGSVITIDGYTVRVVAAAHDGPSLGRDSAEPLARDPLTRDAVLYDVTAPEGTRLLYATDTGPMPDATIDATTGAAFDLVLLEETFGRRHDHGTGHHDLATFPRELARLRATGAIDEHTDVIAVHLGHHNPDGAELDRLLSHWGARVVDDLTVIEVGTRGAVGIAATTRSETRCRTLILGGARSGKSYEAERRLLARPDVHYVATGGASDSPGTGAVGTRAVGTRAVGTRADGTPTQASTGTDLEWSARIAAHLARRPSTWRTSETIDIAALLTSAPHGEPILLDCLSLWLAGQLDRALVWAAESGSPPYVQALEAVTREVDTLVRAVRDTSAHVVMVTNEVGSGIVPEHSSGRLYRDLLGALNARIAAECDVVDLVIAGRVIAL